MSFVTNHESSLFHAVSRSKRLGLLSSLRKEGRKQEYTRQPEEVRQTNNERKETKPLSRQCLVLKVSLHNFCILYLFLQRRYLSKFPQVREAAGCSSKILHACYITTALLILWLREQVTRNETAVAWKQVNSRVCLVNCGSGWAHSMRRRDKYIQINTRMVETNWRCSVEGRIILNWTLKKIIKVCEGEGKTARSGQIPAANSLNDYFNDHLGDYQFLRNDSGPLS